MLFTDMYKWEQTLSYVCVLQSIHLFLPLLKGDQFHAYLKAQAQIAGPRIFAFFSIALTYQNLNTLFNLRLLLVFILV